MSRDAAFDVLGQLPAPSVRRSEVTGLEVWEPREAVRALWALRDHGERLDAHEQDVLERALAHYEQLESPPTDDVSRRTLRRGSSRALADLLGDAAIPHLAEEVKHSSVGDDPLYELQLLGRPPRELVLTVPALTHLRAHDVERYVRTRFAYDAGLAPFLRTLDHPHADHTIRLGALDHDPERLRGAWLENRHRLPPWRVTTAFAPLGLIPRDAGVAFLCDRDERRWVRGLELELWPDFGLRRNPDASLFSLARHDSTRRVVLIAPPDDDGLVESLDLVASPDRLRAAVASFSREEDEARLCVPRISRVLAPHGIVSVDWKDACHSQGIRVGGITRRTFDRPFLLIDWDSRREEALGVGLVTGPLLLEDTLAAVDASALGEGPFVDNGLRKRSWGD